MTSSDVPLMHALLKAVPDHYRGIPADTVAAAMIAAAGTERAPAGTSMPYADMMVPEEG